MTPLLLGDTLCMSEKTRHDCVVDRLVGSHHASRMAIVEPASSALVTRVLFTVIFTEGPPVPMVLDGFSLFMYQVFHGFVITCPLIDFSHFFTLLCMLSPGDCPPILSLRHSFSPALFPVLPCRSSVLHHPFSCAIHCPCTASLMVLTILFSYTFQKFF